MFSRTIDQALDEAIKNYNLPAAKSLILSGGKVIHPYNLLNIFYGISIPGDDKYDRYYRDRYIFSDIPLVWLEPYRNPDPYSDSYNLDVTGLHNVALNHLRSWVQFAIDSKCINAQHKELGDNTILMWAIANNEIDSVKKLLEANANLNIKNKMGLTAIDIATGNNRDEILQLLVVKNQAMKRPSSCTIL